MWLPALTRSRPSGHNHWFHETPKARACHPFIRETLVSISERKKEIKRRRKRREKLTKWKSRLVKATKSEKVEIARKVRAATPGAEVVIANWGLAEVDR